MKQLGDVMLTIRAVFRDREEVTYKEIKEAFLMFTTSYATKKQFVKRYSPTKSFLGFVNLREFLGGNQ